MKKLLTLLAIAFLLPSVTFAYQLVEQSEYLTDIIEIHQDHGFPIENITLTYVKHCSEEFSNVWHQIVEPGIANLGVSVKKVSEYCTLEAPVWAIESVTVQIFAEVPTTYGRLTELNIASPLFSGISVDNFN